MKGMVRIVLPLFLWACTVKAADLNARVEFKAATNMGSLVTGRGQGISGKIEGEVGDVSFELKRLDTGMGLRNRHMLEDLHAEEYPVSVLKWHGPVADLTLNGMTNTVALNHQGQKYTFEFLLTQFGLKGRKYLGVGISDSVEVTVELINR